MANVLASWRRSRLYPGGKWRFSRRFAARAPYFRTVDPQFVRLEPNLAVVRLSRSKKVLNHIGTVHAIAICNAAEAAMGALMEATIPTSKRWIPKGMTVSYLAPAAGDLTCTAKCDPAQWQELPADAGGELVVEVSAMLDDRTEVLCGTITLWVSPKPVKP